MDLANKLHTMNGKINWEEEYPSETLMEEFHGNTQRDHQQKQKSNEQFESEKKAHEAFMLRELHLCSADLQKRKRILLAECVSKLAHIDNQIKHLENAGGRRTKRRKKRKTKRRKKRKTKRRKKRKTKSK